MLFVFNFLCFEISCSSKFLIDGPQVAVKASKMAVVFGECVRECFLGPGNDAAQRSTSSAVQFLQ
jgi:hypothetical protein